MPSWRFNFLHEGMAAYYGLIRAAVPMASGQPFQRPGSRSRGRAAPRAGRAVAVHGVVVRAVAASVRDSRSRGKAGWRGESREPRTSAAEERSDRCPGSESLPGFGIAARVGRNMQEWRLGGKLISLSDTSSPIRPRNVARGSHQCPMETINLPVTRNGPAHPARQCCPTSEFPRRLQQPSRNAAQPRQGKIYTQTIRE
jgi:hypothetical protein